MSNTALIYEWLIHMGGGEKTLAAISEVIPAPIYALVADRKRMRSTPFSDKDIRHSFLQQFPFARQLYRYYLPFFPYAVEHFDVSSYECVISVSHAVAKGVLTHPHQLHLCYCFTPMRYAWDLSQDYLKSIGPLQRMLAIFALHKLRNWDIASLGRVDHFAAISHHVARRIKKIYGREAEVIYPPVETDRIALHENKEDFFLTVSRMVPYKKIDLIVEAFSQCPDKKLIVIGDGPEMAKVKRKARKNIEILGFQSDANVITYLQKARGFIFAAEEDFGIVPLEAQAAGTPVIAFGKGGALETIVEEKSGIFFEEQTVASLLSALKRFERINWDPAHIRSHALRFNKQRFQEEFHRFVSLKTEAFYENRHLGRR